MLRSLLTSFILFSCIVYAKAQTCGIQASTQKICLGATVALSPLNADVNDTAWNWNFGDGSSSGQRNPTYQYLTPGNYTITLTVYRRTGTTCTATLKVDVLNKPVAKYTLLTARSQCFEGNHFVFSDLSTPGPSNAPIRKRVVLFEDGGIIQENVPYGNTFDHSYGDAAGDKYKVVMEITDTNGCISQYIDSVVVFPQKKQISFTVQTDIQCNQTKVVFTNLSGFDATNARSIRWIVDSNVVYTSPWNLLTHTYTGNRKFEPWLIIEDNNGCIDTARLGYDVYSFVPDSSITVKDSAHSCFKPNAFRFSNPTLLGNFLWTITDANNKLVQSFNQPSFSYTFGTCGLYKVKLFYFFSNCTFETDTQVFVYGPSAVMLNDSVHPLNWMQCTPKDTVEFNVPDVNCRFGNGPLQFFWNFNDPFAPPCTTSTRLGQNVGVNCNFSTDSVRIKHFYQQPNASCYYPSVTITDPVRGCMDRDSIALRISQPMAGWDSSFVPPLPRVYMAQSLCSRDVLFHLERLIPLCGPREVWLLPDSGCFTSGWFKIDSFGILKQFPFSYLNLCDTVNGKIVFGIAVSNGPDASGQMCYDTTYYHDSLDLAPPVNFDFIYEDTGACKPFTVKFTPKDTVMKDLKEVAWNFGDGTPTLRIAYGPNDSIIWPQKHTYLEGGSYPVSLAITTIYNCYSIETKIVPVGVSAMVNPTQPIICAGTDAVFTATILYNTPGARDFWADTLRRDAGKEQVYWNFGDSGKWVLGMPRMVYRYANPGTYFVKIAYRDSSVTGCFDTISAINTVGVKSVTANIFQFVDTFYCAPTIASFIDSSYIQSDTFTRVYSVVKRAWDFGADRPPSLLRDPSVFYNTNGVFKARLIVESIHGCIDTMEKDVVVIGPQPYFVIVDDTFGCAPFTVRFRNETHKQLKNWIWSFNDTLKTIVSTNRDTDVVFTYTFPGVYQIDLLGDEDIFNPVTGSYKSCPISFPYVDPNNPYHSRRITVLESDTLSIVSTDKVCVDEVFTATVEDSIYVAMVEWLWGDSSQNSQVPILSAASHSYDSPGVYTLAVKPVITAKGQCVLGAEKEITVQKPMADFEYTGLSYPTFAFTNKSTNAVRYQWDFGQPFSPNNSSTAENPEHTFVIESKDYKACLMAFDDRDCMDSVCKILPARSSIKIPNVFTPSNRDGNNDAFDIEIEGWTKYELFIYNRWGNKVFESTSDGIQNDGVNWDGTNKNDGSQCPAGVYYVIFRYKLFNRPQEEVYNGTVTLIRE